MTIFRHGLAVAAICLTLVVIVRIDAQTGQTPSDIFKRGTAAIAAKDYNLAVTEFTQYIQQMPNSSAAYANRALAYKGLNSKELAIEDLSKAIELKPGEVTYYISRGLAYKELGRDDLSLADSSKVLELQPDNTAAYVNRAEIYTNRRQLDDALADVSRAIQLNNKIGKAYWVRSNIYTIQAVWESAARDMNQAIALDPSQKSLHHTLAWMEMHIGNDQAAVENAAKFLDSIGMKNDRSGWTLVAGYLALLRTGKRDEAEKFIARYPREEAAGVMPRKALELLRDNLTEAELLAEAGDDPIKRTDARSIIGLKLLINGKNEEAIKNLSWVKENGKKGPTTYALALVELAKLTSKNIPGAPK